MDKKPLGSPRPGAPRKRSPGRYLLLAGALAALAVIAFVWAASPATRYGLGQPLTQDQVDFWNIHPSILADGRGLPPGKGTVDEGAQVYQAQCAACHGASGEGGAFNRLVAEPFPVGRETSPRDFAVGNYWQYSTTLFDYIRRAMPFSAPGSLKDDEVYAVVAWILYQNGIIDGNEPMNAQTLPKVKRPSRDNLVLDPVTQKKYPWMKLP